jgi:hypothetical protein
LWRHSPGPLRGDVRADIGGLNLSAWTVHPASLDFLSSLQCHCRRRWRHSSRASGRRVRRTALSKRRRPLPTWRTSMRSLPPPDVAPARPPARGDPRASLFDPNRGRLCRLGAPLHHLPRQVPPLADGAGGGGRLPNPSGGAPRSTRSSPPKTSAGCRSS